MSQKKNNIRRSVTKVTVSENLRLPTILPSKPRDPRARSKPVMTGTPPTAGTPGGTRRKRRSPSRQRTPVGGVKDYVKEYQQSLVLPPLDYRSRSNAKVVTFPKGREVYKQSTHHHHSNTPTQSCNHHSNAYGQSTHHYSNSAYPQSDHHHDNNMCQKTAHHHKQQKRNNDLEPQIQRVSLAQISVFQ